MHPEQPVSSALCGIQTSDLPCSRQVFYQLSYNVYTLILSSSFHLFLHVPLRTLSVSPTSIYPSPLSLFPGETRWHCGLLPRPVQSLPAHDPPASCQTLLPPVADCLRVRDPRHHVPQTRSLVSDELSWRHVGRNGGRADSAATTSKSSLLLCSLH